MTHTPHTGRARRIHTALTAAFTPTRLAVEDESHQHAGHTGARPEGETHFHVLMACSAFANASRLARSRMVHAALADEFPAGLHALRLTLLDPADPT